MYVRACEQVPLSPLFPPTAPSEKGGEENSIGTKWQGQDGRREGTGDGDDDGTGRRYPPPLFGNFQKGPKGGRG